MGTRPKRPPFSALIERPCTANLRKPTPREIRPESEAFHRKGLLHHCCAEPARVSRLHLKFDNRSGLRWYASAVSVQAGIPPRPRVAFFPPSFPRTQPFRNIARGTGFAVSIRQNVLPPTVPNLVASRQRRLLATTRVCARGTQGPESQPAAGRAWPYRCPGGVRVDSTDL